MRPGHARKKNGARYRYYVSGDLVERGVASGATGWRIPAGEMEAVVARAIAAWMREPGFKSDVLKNANTDAGNASRIIKRIEALADQVGAPGSDSCQALLRSMLIRVDLLGTGLRAEVRFATSQEVTDADPIDAALSGIPPFQISAAIQMQRRGPELRLVLQGAAASAPNPDALLIRTLIEGRIRAADYLDPELELSVSDIARRDGADVGDISRSLQRAFLAPDLVECILDGTQPLALTAERFKRIGELPLLGRATSASRLISSNNFNVTSDCVSFETRGACGAGRYFQHRSLVWSQAEQNFAEARKQAQITALPPNKPAMSDPNGV